jgi:hypothetical protein
MVAYNKHGGLPRTESLKDINAIRYESLETSGRLDPAYY